MAGEANPHDRQQALQAEGQDEPARTIDLESLEPAGREAGRSRRSDDSRTASQDLDLGPASGGSVQVLFAIPIYNTKGLNAVLSDLRPYIQPFDTFLVISGNNGNPLNPDWVMDTASKLRSEFPENEIVAGTAGLTNIRVLAGSLGDPVSGITYVYEPNMANEPEFTWDFQETLNNYRQFASEVRAKGFDAIGKPTGRPALQEYLQSWQWDYGALGAEVDRQFIQTQTYCKRAQFGDALDRIIEDYSQSPAAQFSWYAEITVDPQATNGVSPERALECTGDLVDRGLARVLMWWSPSYTVEAVAYLQGVR